MRIEYITLEEILRLHFQLIEDFDGSHGVRDENRLKAIANTPRQHVFGSEQYPSLYAKAAVYLRNTIGDHPFSDDNKRTAVIVCGIFLARNKHALTAAPSELENFAVSVATNHPSIEEIAIWLQNRTI